MQAVKKAGPIVRQIKYLLKLTKSVAAKFECIPISLLCHKHIQLDSLAKITSKLVVED